MEQLPIFLELEGKRVVVTGGGTIAARKADLALKAGADVLVVAPELGHEFHALSSHPKLRHRAGTPAAADLDGALIAFSCLDDDAEDRSFVELARANRVLVNVPDTPDLSDFVMPAILDRSPLVVAISSGGASPLLVRIIKERLESTIPAAFGNLARFLGEVRTKVAQRMTDLRSRRRFLETIVDGPIADLVLAGDEARAHAELERAMSCGTGDVPYMVQVQRPSPSISGVLCAQVRQFTCLVVLVSWQNSCASQNLHWYQDWSVLIGSGMRSASAMRLPRSMYLSATSCSYRTRSV